MQTELHAEQIQAEQDQTRARCRIAALTDQRAKLLTAHYTDAVPLDLLKVEMTRLAREKIDAENKLATASATLTDLTGQLERALAVAGSCNRHYGAAPPRIRRQINQGLFKALYLHRDGSVAHVELTEPFAQLLADDLLSSVSAQATLTEEPADRQNDTPADAANRARPSTVCAPASLTTRHTKRPSRICWGTVCTTSVWCPRWESNPHWTGFESANSPGRSRRAATMVSGRTHTFVYPPSLIRSNSSHRYARLSRRSSTSARFVISTSTGDKCRNASIRATICAIG